jgi:hypothetical protein
VCRRKENAYYLRRLARAAGLACQQGRQFARMVKVKQLITATHMVATNENLRDRTSPRDLHHDGALARVCIHPNLLEIRDAALHQEVFGAGTKRTVTGGK